MTPSIITPATRQSISTSRLVRSRVPRQPTVDRRLSAPTEVLRPEAASEMRFGRIPNVQATCLELMATFFSAHNQHSAMQFLAAMQKATIDAGHVARFLDHPTTRHVLVENHLMKVVLIHWQPGEASAVHGHPEGGCVFKVLQGKLIEKRFNTDANQQLLTTTVMHKNDLAYIDNAMAYHAVGNPFSEPAISLHAYTPGKK